MIVSTGYGYFKDVNGNIVSKYELPIGEHPVADGLTPFEVADKAALDSIEIWSEPISPEDSFNVVEFQTDLLGLLPNLSSINLRLEFAALNAFATNKDFNGMVQYLGFLLTNNIATQDDVDAVLSLLAKQGIITS